MSGHSHWSGIKHKKAAIDAKRGKLWSKLARVVIVAARAGGGDPAANLALRYAIDKCKDANMPKDTIEKAIKKGTGDTGGVAYEEVLYEGYGPNGVAVMCEVLTDNRNRTAGELRRIFDRKGGSLGATGCVAWMFTKKGFIAVKNDAVDEDTLMELALEAGADDMTPAGDMFEITCEVDAYAGVKKALEEKAIPIEAAELIQEASTTVPLDAAASRKILDLMENLEDQDDVQAVHANFDIPDEIMAQIEADA